MKPRPMTTNEERAAEVIAEVFRPLAKGHADSMGRDLVAQLAKEGLIAPDLPVVTHRSGMGVAGTDFPMTGGRFASVNLKNSAEYLWTLFDPGSVTLIHNQGKRTDAKGRRWPDTRDMYLTPDAAREIAYTLLAAANHAEGDHHD